MVSSWDKSVETGNAMIDSQHHALLDLLDDLEQHVKSRTELLDMLDEVADFTIDPFVSEEQLMAEVSYPPDATKTMVDQHEEFKAYELLRIREFYKTETIDVIPFKSFVVNFLKVHEFGLDCQLADWIRQQEETSRAA